MLLPHSPAVLFLLFIISMEGRTRCFLPQRRQIRRNNGTVQPSQSLFKASFPALAALFIRLPLAEPYPAPQTVLFTFLSLKKKTMQNRYSFCGRQWTMPIQPGFLNAHLRRKE